MKGRITVRFYLKLRHLQHDILNSSEVVFAYSTEVSIP